MVGTPTLFLVRDLVVERLENQPQASLQDALQHLTAEPAYGYLGALGVNLFDFIPTTPPGLEEQETDGRRLDAYAAIWRELFTILSDPEAQDDPNRNILAVLLRVRELIADLLEIAENESVVQFATITGRLDQWDIDRDIIENFIPRLTDSDLYTEIFKLITVASRPYPNVETGEPIPASSRWGLRDHVCAFRTGAFAERLLERARERFEQDGDRRFLAYAYGFRIAYCTKVVGSPFVNAIVGSLPRLHWWRSRWIERFVDAWAWGSYDPSRPDPLDDGREDFLNWRGLCNANLHRRIALGQLEDIHPIVVMQSTVLNRPLPDAVPEDFRSFVADTFREIYGDEDALSLVNERRVNDAVVWSWLTLWFTTGSDALGCNPAPPLSIEDGTAFFDPDTVNPFEMPPAAGDEDQDGLDPLDMQPEPDPNTRKSVCGVILAYLGIATAGVAGALAGLAQVAAGLKLFVEGEANINWVSFRRDLYAVRWYLYNAVDGMDRMLVFSALGHPYPYELDDPELRLEVPNQPSPPCGFPAGPVLYTARRTDQFPAAAWDAADPLQSWICPPPASGGPLEMPTSVGYASNGTPDLFIDGLSDPDVAGLVLDHRAFPPPPVWPDPGAPNIFASAVDNAIDVILREGEGNLPDLNLQGDRGIGYRAWRFAGTTQTDSVQIEPAS